MPLPCPFICGTTTSPVCSVRTSLSRTEPMVLIMGVWISVTGIGKEPIVRSFRVAVITTSLSSCVLRVSSVWQKASATTPIVHKKNRQHFAMRLQICRLADEGNTSKSIINNYLLIYAFILVLLAKIKDFNPQIDFIKTDFCHFYLWIFKYQPPSNLKIPKKD